MPSLVRRVPPADREPPLTSIAFFELILMLVAGALALTLAAGRLHLPPAAALVVGGMVLALVPGVPAFALDPNLILVLFLPPLLLASAYETVWRDFRASLRPILLMSVGAVVFTTLCVALVARWLAPGLPWAACVALGAVVSPPDAVAAKAVLQHLTLPRRLMTVIEGESLVNDASGLVIYRFAVIAAATGNFSAGEASLSFVWMIVGGIAIGAACGYAAMEIMRRLRDDTATIMTSFFLAYVSYILAEHVEASGVLAVVAAGGVVSFKGHQIFRASARIKADAVWETVVSVLEAFVFVLIGLSLRGLIESRGGALVADLPLAAAVTAAVVVSRFLYVYPSTIVSNLIATRGRGQLPPVPILVVLCWAGMRGVVTLAAALALPLGFPGRDAILVTCFAVILFTVLVQGTTLGPLIARLGLQRYVAAPSATMLDLNGARLAVHRTALATVEAMLSEATGQPLHPQLAEMFRKRISGFERLRAGGEEGLGLHHDHFAASLAALTSGRAELIRLNRQGRVHDSVLRMVESELDLEELRLARIAG